MKIIVIGTRGFPGVQGGVENHCENLYKHLVDLGCQVTVLGRKPYVGKEIYEHNKIKIIPVSCPKRKSIEALTHSLCGIFIAKRMDCDILHVHALGSSLLIPIARFLGLRVVMTIHGLDYKREKWGMIAKTVLKLGEKLGSRWANAVICVSEEIADYIGIKYKRPVNFIPNGVNIPETCQSQDSLSKYGLEDKKYILTVGRFSREKGFDDLIDGFDLLQKSSHSQSSRDCKLVIVGNADHPDSYSQKIFRKSKDNPNIVLTGVLSGQTLNEIYSHAGLFVLPSHHEGLPIALLEALSYGLSCIASDIPSVKHLSLLSEDRYFVPRNPKALALKLAAFINKPLTQEEKVSLFKKLSEKYNWSKIAAQTYQTYKRTLAR